MNKDTESISDKKSAIRSVIRKKRRHLTAATQKLSSRKILLKIQGNPIFSRSKNIALYIASDGEISVWPLIQLALRKKKNVYLPRIKNREMIFYQYLLQNPLSQNSFGIQEPHISKKSIEASKLDLVFVPLVAFDKDKNRLGMGGGYYDRAFSFVRKRWRPSPFLFGVAHDFQEVQTVPEEEQDVSLHAVVSVKKMIC